MVSEIRTNAVLNLFKLMVAKGKQHLELQEHLNYLKQLQIKTNMVYRQTGMLQMSQTERDCIKFSDLRIKSIVIDQWKLFAHYKVRQETHKNIGLTKLFNVLGNRRYQVKFDALHRLSKYAIHLK